MFDESGLTKSGTITFNADLTFTAETTTSGTMRMTEPLACLPSASNCDDVAASIGLTADADVKAFAAKTLPTLKNHLTMARDLQNKVGK